MNPLYCLTTTLVSTCSRRVLPSIYRGHYGVGHKNLTFATSPVTRLTQGVPWSSCRQLSSKNKIREESKESDDTVENTGFVDVESNHEALFYFDHIYPNTVSNFRFKQYLNYILPSKKSDEELKTRVLRLSNSKEKPLPENTNIVDFIPMNRDGGAFVKFSFPNTTTAKDLTGKIMYNVKHHKEKLLNEKKLRYIHDFIFNGFPAVFPVKGSPWIEDLRRFPSPRLTVKCEGQLLTEEEIYCLFRRYGRIVDVIPQSSSNPATTIAFMSIRLAICAKNCITGIVLNDGKTSVHVQYLPIKRVNYLANFINNHQRIAIPIILALLATIVVLIFDPIRQFFIEERIAHRFSLENYKDSWYVQSITSPFTRLINWIYSGYDYIEIKFSDKCYEELISNDSDLIDESEFGTVGLWAERNEIVKQLKLWIYENINTFIIVRGPKGSGKRELVLEGALMDDENLRKRILYLDCDAMIKSRSDTKLIENVAGQLGYFPVFSWINSISQFVDLGVQGITGQKSGISESKETQIKNMLLLTTQAVKDVALDNYKSYKKDVDQRRKRQQYRQRQSGEKETKLEELLKEEDYLQQHPEVKPVIVINKFLQKSDNHEFIYKMMSDWASTLIQSNLAHVIFITSDVGSIQHLNHSLPNQVFKYITLNDASNKSSQQYVINQLRRLRFEVFDNKLIESCVAPIGGRMLDLQAFLRRIRSGETPNDALNEIVSQAAEQINSFFLQRANDDEKVGWESAQVWELIKLLAENDSIKYNDLTKSPLFKPAPATLETLSLLEKNDLVSLKRDRGILSEVTTGRPIYKTAFKQLVGDVEVFKVFEIGFYNNLVATETAKIHKLEDELTKIQGTNLKQRQSYLQNKIESSNSKVMDFESKISQVSNLQPHQQKGSILGIF